MKTFLKICLFICLFPFSLIYLAFRKKRKPSRGASLLFAPVTMSADANRHYDLLNEINEVYSSVISKKAYTGSLARRLEALCIEDIQIAPRIWKELKKGSLSVPVYPSYRQLATLYERRGEYDKAAEICRRAISDGYNDDGTKMKMSGRLARIEKQLTK